MLYEVITGMKKRNYGRIVNTASIAGQIGHPDIWYGIAKAGVINARNNFVQHTLYEVIRSAENKGIASLIDGNVVFETGTAFDYLAEGESEVVILNYEMQDDKGASSSSTIIV